MAKNKHKHHRPNPEPEPASAETAAADAAPAEANDASEPDGGDAAPAVVAIPVGEDADAGEAVGEGDFTHDEPGEGGDEESDGAEETPAPFDRAAYIAAKAAGVPASLGDLVAGETPSEIDASIALLAEAAKRMRQATPIGSHASPLRPPGSPSHDALSAEDKIRLGYGRNN